MMANVVAAIVAAIVPAIVMNVSESAREAVPEAGDDVPFGFWQHCFFSLFASAQTNEHSLVAFDEAPSGRGYFGPGPLPL